MSNAKAGMGTKLQRGNGDGPPETFTGIAEIQNIQQTGSKNDTIDVTNMDSVGGYREFIATLSDGGEVAFSGNYLPGDQTQQNLQADFNNKVIRNWQIQMPNNIGTWHFQALVVGYDKDWQFDKEMKISGKLKISGLPTFTTP